MKNSTKSTREGSSRGEHTGSRLLQSSMRLWLILCMCMEAFEWKQEAAESARLQKRRSPKKIQQVCEQLLLPDKSWEGKKRTIRVRLTWDAPTCSPQVIQLFICKRPVNSNFVTWINRCDARGRLELQVHHTIVEGAAGSLTSFLLCCDWVCCCTSASETLWLAELLEGKCSASLMFKEPVRQHPGEMNHWSWPE